MLHRTHRGDPELGYQGGQDLIVHLEVDLHEAVDWAEANERRWAFTTSNAGAVKFDDFARLDQLDEIDWTAVLSSNWSREFHRGKEAEFLVEWSLPWELVSRVCVRLPEIREQVYDFLRVAEYQPRLELAPAWYFE